MTPSCQWTKLDTHWPIDTKVITKQSLTILQEMLNWPQCGHCPSSHQAVEVGAKLGSIPNKYEHPQKQNLKIPMMRSRCGTILPRCTSTETGTLWSDLRTPDTVCSCRFTLTGFPLECTSGNLCQQYHTNKARLISMYRMSRWYTLLRRKTFRKIYGLCGKIPERLRIL